VLTHPIQFIDTSHPPGFSTGCDFSGDIVALGDKVDASNFKVGDAVSGMVSNSKDNGAFQGKASARYPENFVDFILLSFRICRDPSKYCRSAIAIDLSINVAQDHPYAWVALPRRGRGSSGDEYRYFGTSSIFMISAPSFFSRPSAGF